ncbi:MAG: hypothetical protein WB799_17975 [Candidatus Sulfotelmatobacter sp.]
MTTSAATKVKEIRKAHPELFQEERSLARKIAESSLYDWNASARFLLTQIAVLSMDEDSTYPDDAPEAFKADKEGWCWMSQGRLAIRIGKSLSTVEKLIAQFRKDGVIQYRDWRDDNKTLHAEYKIVESVIDAQQRPSQRADVERPPRYEKSRKGTASHRPRDINGKFLKQVDDDE